MTPPESAPGGLTALSPIPRTQRDDRGPHTATADPAPASATAHTPEYARDAVQSAGASASAATIGAQVLATALAGGRTTGATDATDATGVTGAARVAGAGGVIGATGAGGMGTAARVPRRLAPRVARAIYVVLDLLVIPPLLLVLHLAARVLGRNGLDRVAVHLGAFIARAFRCRAARRTLRVLRGAGLVHEDTRTVVAAAASHQLRTIAEIVTILDLEQAPLDEIVSVDGREHLDQALREGHGVILVSSHMSNWEVAAAAMVGLGYPLSILYFQQLSWLLDRYLSSLRRRHGVGLLHQRRGLKSAIRALNDNRILGIMMDQDGTRHGVFTQMFGMDVSVPRGAAVLALRHGACVVPSHCVRLADGHLKIVIRPRLTVERTDSPEADIARLTHQILGEIERSVAQAPDQWLIFYDRFMLRHSAKLSQLGLLDRALARETLLGDGD